MLMNLFFNRITSYNVCYTKLLRSINESKGKKTTQYLGIFNRINSDKFKDDSKIIEDFKVENEDMLGQLLDKNITVKWVNFMVISLVIENYNELLSINKTYNSLV